MTVEITEELIDEAVGAALEATRDEYVYDSRIDALVERVAKLNRRAVKLSVPMIELVVGEREVVYCLQPPQHSRLKTIEPWFSTDPHAWDGADGRTDEYEVIRHERALVDLHGDPPCLDGWTFAAVIDHLSGGTIQEYPRAARRVDLAQFRNADNSCDHCNTKRKRKETFVVVHEDGRVMRVGRSCLADFLNHHGNPRTLLNALDVWNKALGELMDFRHFGVAVEDHEVLIDLREYLAFVAISIDRYGWMSKGKAWEEQCFMAATAERASRAFCISKDNLKRNLEDRGRVEIPTEGHFERAERVIEWVRALTEADIGDSDYLYNLHAVCEGDLLRFKRIGLAASAVNAAEREFKQLAEKERTASLSNEFVGEIKKRMALTLTLRGTLIIDGFYGATVLHRFEDETGNSLAWFASNPSIINDIERCGDAIEEVKRSMKIGETVDLCGTVKRHEEYHGRKQTTLTRVALPPKKKKKAPRKKKAAAVAATVNANGPSKDGSIACRNAAKSIAAGGMVEFCTCAACF